MKHRIHILVTAAAFAAAVPGWAASASASSSTTTQAGAAQASEGKATKQELRVLSSTVAERRPSTHRLEVREMVTFLGVETGPVSATLSAQLDLQPGTGLVVNNVVPGSPAESVLRQHDILQKFDDQLLVESRQLAVLVQGKKEGDEVALTYLRGGKPQTAMVKLGKQEAPKVMLLGRSDLSRVYALGGGNIEMLEEATKFGGEQQSVDRLLALVPRDSSPPPTRFRFESKPGEAFSASRVYSAESNLVFSDDAGSLKVVTGEGKRTLVATDGKGTEIFSGPINTPEERAKIPAELRARLEKLESMYDVTFKTDGDFRGVERRVLRPKGISLPFEQSIPRPARVPSVL